MRSVDIDDVRAARKLLDGVVRMTPLEHSRVLAAAAGGPVHLKCENLQRTGSFKIRGAYTRISRLTPEQLARMVSLVTGWDVDVDELLAVGERRLNLMRAFNAREGIGREEDRLPKKMFQALKGGESDGVALTEEEIESALDMYYELAGWDVESGMPTREKLENLGFEWLA